MVWFTSTWFYHNPPWFLSLTYYLHTVHWFSTFCWQFRAILSLYSLHIHAPLYRTPVLSHLSPSSSINLSKCLIACLLLSLCCLCSAPAAAPVITYLHYAPVASLLLNIINALIVSFISLSKTILLPVLLSILSLVATRHTLLSLSIYLLTRKTVCVPSL